MAILAITGSAQADPLAFTENATVTKDVVASESMGPGEGGYTSALRVDGPDATVNLNGASITASMDVNRSWTEAGTDYTFSGVSANAFNGQQGGILNLGSDATQSVVIDVNVNGTGVTNKGETVGLGAIGLWAYNAYQKPENQKNNGGLITVKGNTLNVNVHSEQGSAYGIYAQNASTATTAEAPSTLVINTDYTNIVATSGENGSSSAIVAMSEGIIEIDSNLYAKGSNAIVARGDAVIDINKNGNKTVQLEGDINFNYDKATSGTKVDADVSVNLTGPDSYWNGNAITSYGTGSTTEDKMEVSGLKLGLSDGAQWTPDLFTDYSEDESGESEIAINQLAFNDGVINVRHGTEQRVRIQNMTGSGGTINLTASTDDGETIQAGTVDITNASENTVLAVNAVGITADDISNDEAALQSINEKVSNGVTKTSTVAEGDIRGMISQTFNQAGEAVGDVTRQENTKLLSFRGVNAASLVAWRDEVAYTNQRMEYLRDNTHAFGAWAQVYGGESSYDDATVDLTTTTVQVGADTTIGDWIAGAAFSYSKGDADMVNGSADTDSYTLSLYTARNFDSGFYVNGLARYGRLSTDATAGNMTASYDNNAFSIGGNVGYRFNFAQQAFVEPNFGLQYAYVMGDDYTATNGVKVEQDDFDALIASLGARVGFNFAEDAGKIYARASVNHDFLGEVDGTASKAGLADSMYVDLGGTWVTYGIGTQFNFTENLSVWGNLDRTTGGEVSTHYMMNAGLRYVF